MNRRKFISKTAVGAGALAITHKAFGAENMVETNQRLTFETPKTTPEGEMIYRTLGATGERVSAIRIRRLSSEQTENG